MLLDQGFVHEFYNYKTMGTMIGSNHSSNNRLAGFIIKAENEKDMLEKTKVAYESIVVRDFEGNIVPHHIPELRLDLFMME